MRPGNTMQATLVSYGNLNDLLSGGEARKSFARLRGPAR